MTVTTTLNSGGSEFDYKLGSVLRKRSMIATGLGNCLEWFDWTIYAIFASYIAKAMFDPRDPASALLGTLAIFAVGFISRPLGGIVFGTLSDSRGRKAVLLISMLLMGIGSLVIAVAPSYASIGGVASFIILSARLLQGFAHGGEATASYTYLAEIAPKGRRGLWSSSMYFFAGMGSLLASLVGAFLTHIISPEDMSMWGWRIPFYLGATLTVIVLFLRRNMIESEVLEDYAKKSDPVSPGAARVVEWSNKKILQRSLGIFFYQAGVGIPFYIWTGYAVVIAITQRGMDPGDAFVATVLAQVVYIVGVPFWGYVSDRVGRKPVTLFYFVAVALLTFPAMAMITNQGWTLFVAQGGMLALVACIGGTMPATITEQIPTRYRARVMGGALSIGVAVFGGTAPYLNSWLSGSDRGWVFNIYVITIVLVAAAVVATWRETKGIDLRDVN
ncbi:MULTISPECIES: MFS transporter [Pseudomonas]|uniref:Major facilitator transporter n=3 Tax=Pseudomonas TaxID=286 RepID=V9V4A2_9PSED|nr:MULTISPECIES: MFS transporter [Pseudomonas]AEJ14615.1 major facilitator superfamily metabolite/H(+) symporter [Pseudomonas putida S16]AHC84126.1 major facilitator transporter [Pseudomonas monteilii SB3078]AHC89497.1 major facilitator transporter [Pseudomonas monteilii SB3101]ANI35917.1 major facilitator transporter [Pseudomonas sp. JY-Q]MDD2040207.1 MFS transporter [Pseudomonas putida]